MSEKLKVLVTGSAGLVGQALVGAMHDRYTLYGFDRVPTRGLETAKVGDLFDFDAVLEAMQGMNAVVHLGGEAAPSASWEEILHSNIIGAYNAYEAAHRAGIKRFVFASRAALVKGYPIDVMRKIDFMPQFTSYYSVSKYFGESMGSYYSKVHGMEVVSVRIGNFIPERAAPTHPHHIGASDLVRVFDQAITHPDVKFEIVFGVSDSSYPMYDLDHGRRVLGYEPQERSKWSRSRVVRALRKLSRW